MKILLIDVYHYNKGGAETVYFNTGKMLEEQGQQVVYFALQWKENLPCKQKKYFPLSKGTRKGVFKNVINLINYFYYADAAKKIEELIIDEKPDIAHIHLLWGQISPSIFPVLKKYHIPIVFTIHDYRIICPAYCFKDGYNQICERCKGRNFYQCIIRKCTKSSYFLSLFMAGEQYFRNMFFNPAKNIDGLLYVSNFAKNMHEKYMPALKGIPNITLHNFVIGNFINTQKKDTDKYFLYFGRLSSEKGIRTLLEAFKEQSDLKLKLVGTGPLEHELKQFARIQKLSNVEFLGYKTGGGLNDLIENAFFVIVPSEWYENNPMSIIESYSVGTPVIGANIGGIPEIVIDNKSGYIFESANVDNLITCIDKASRISTGEYQQMVSECRRLAAEDFGREAYCNRLLEFYKQLLIRK